MMQQIALLIELQHRRRGGATLRGLRSGGGVLFTRFERSGAMNDPDVILVIHRDADGLAHDPVVGQRLGPQRIHFKSRSLNSRGLDYGFFCQLVRPDAEGGNSREKSGANVEIAFHDAFIIVI